MGFKREGVCRQSVLKNGKYVDEYIYGLLREEWKSSYSLTEKYGIISDNIQYILQVNASCGDVKYR